MKRRNKGLWLLIGFILFFCSCGLNLVSRRQEIEMGRQISREVEKDPKVRLLDDPEITYYIQTIGQKLARNSRWPDLTYHFKIIDSKEVNAFALPGGYLYVFRGLLDAVDNEAELASVLGHEIAHVTERHATKQMTKAQIYQIVATIGGAATGAGQAGQMVAGLGGALLLTKFSREDEAEADKYGMEYMIKAGYQPEAMITMFQKLLKLHKEKPNLLEKLFASHPAVEDRIREAQLRLKSIDIPNKKDLILNTPQFKRIKTRLGVMRQFRGKD
jgi:predicted Zn-dependent protease